MSFWDCPILKAVVEVLVGFCVAWICATHEMASSWLLTPPPAQPPPPVHTAPMKALRVHCRHYQP